MQERFLKAIEELRKQPKRNFEQTVELIINLQDFDVRKESLNLFVQLPHKSRKNKICAFLERPSTHFDFCILKGEIEKWQDKKQIKKLGRDYDFFVSLAPLMAKVATQFGRVLGPQGKMPSPQLGVLTSQDDAKERDLAERIRNTTRIKAKEPSIKIAIGKEKMPDKELAENAAVIYNAVLAALPRKKENLKSVMLKFTMSKPIKVGK